MPATQSQSTRVKPRNSQQCARSATRQGLVTPAMRRARSSSRGSRGARSTCRVRGTAIRNRIRHPPIRASLGIEEGMPWQNELTILTLRRW
jgi:hypothetical protein